MKHVTIGVTGHEDHGKSCLIKALTGIDTDRLQEEKERGMSIVLGFAPLELPEGMIDLIDVPGHERLIKTMIAGATGMDAAILVIAADEAIKAQTIEHLDLLNLMGIRQGIVAITKVDLIDDEDRAELFEWVTEFCAGTFLQSAPIIFTSVETGEGLDTLRDALRQIVAQCDATSHDHSFYLPVDRIFTMPDHGIVVTGTLRGGSVEIGDTIEIMPTGKHAQVQGLEVHGESVPVSLVGWRTAVNLIGVNREDLNRGDALSPVGYLQASSQVDVKLQLSLRAPEPLKNGLQVRFHYGTTEAMGRVSCLSPEIIMPGETGFVQLRFQHEVAVPYGERVVVRTVSPVATLGGGMVIDPAPARYRRGRHDLTNLLLALSEGNGPEILVEKLWEARFAGLDLRRFSETFHLDITPLKSQLRDLPIVFVSEHQMMHRHFFDELIDHLLKVLAQFHQDHPSQPGLSKGALREAMPEGMFDAAFCPVLDAQIHQGTVSKDAGIVRLSQFYPVSDLLPEEQQIADEIETVYKSARFLTPSIDSVVVDDDRRKQLFQYLVKRQVLVTFTDQMHRKTVVFHHDVLSEAETILPQSLGTESFSVAQATAILETTRKYSIPILEYLDKIGVTHRVGDHRVCEPLTIC